MQTIQEIVQSTIDIMTKQAVEQIIRQNTGYGLTDGLVEMVRDRAAEILKEPEMDKALREALARWIQRH